MQVHLFHLMPYADLDLDFDKKYKSSWVVLSNSYFDPEKGKNLYNRYLDELEYGEELGFDGLCVNEHHQNAYGIMPSPIVTASALARTTKRAKIAVVGNAFGIREHPLTLAEEHAMLDCITGGRLISGMVRGIGCEYYSMGANPAFSHERFHEAHDLVIQAWTKPGPFAFEGKHYHFEYVNVWPRVYQQPHPPIWCPSQGSFETIEWTAHPDRKYTYLQTYSPFTAVMKFMSMYRDMARKYGYEAQPEQLGWLAPIYVADTDEKAIDEARPHIEAFANKFLKNPLEMLLPPGYTSTASLRNIRKAKAGLSVRQTIELLMESEVIIVGSPDTVREKLLNCQRKVALGNLLALLQFGTLPADLTKRNMDLFAAEVMPALQASNIRTPSEEPVAAE
ncbi:MAG: LLM class flavin-dependent oxidoreductase [Rhodospirillaceae bacterium]|nr:LLM class flavin-dependent oxidoreductase [Rhodospirillaceae bacterium]